METVADIFNKLKGAANVARILGVGPSTASEMKRRSSIPPAYWPTLVESDLGREVGLSADILMHAHAHANAKQAGENAA